MSSDRPHRDPVDLLGAGPGAAELAGLQDELAGLQDRLAVAAEDEGLLDVAFRTLDTPLGAVLLAATPAGLVRLAFEREGFDAVLDDLAGRIGPRVLRAPRPLDQAARQVQDYLLGHRTRFDLALDLRLANGFRRSVLAWLPNIGYGRTASYQAVAAAAGSPKAARAVGTACATNPLPIVIPCHRVVRGDGRLGGYLAGPAVKQRLLDLEARR